MSLAEWRNMVCFSVAYMLVVERSFKQLQIHLGIVLHVECKRNALMRLCIRHNHSMTPSLYYFDLIKQECIFSVKLHTAICNSATTIHKSCCASLTMIFFYLYDSCISCISSSKLVKVCSNPPLNMLADVGCKMLLSVDRIIAH